ncbi:MAG TPA: cytochrome c-type biogenesis protein [Rugosibacter sp.]
MKFCRFLIFLFLLISPILPALASEALPLAPDEAVEKRMLFISEELRCLVCQNETLAASRADLANDLRREIRSLIAAGKTDQEILDFMVARYGDFVRYRPPFKPTTWLLWSGPFLLMGGGLITLIWLLRRRRQVVMPELSDEQRRQAAALLDKTDR